MWTEMSLETLTRVRWWTFRISLVFTVGNVGAALALAVWQLSARHVDAAMFDGVVALICAGLGTAIVGLEQRMRLMFTDHEHSTEQHVQALRGVTAQADMAEAVLASFRSGGDVTISSDVH